MPWYDFRCPSCLRTVELSVPMNGNTQRHIDYCEYCNYTVLYERVFHLPQIQAMPRALRPENRVYEDKIDRKARIEQDQKDYDRGWDGVNAKKPSKPKPGDLAQLHRQLHGR